jgi:Mn2+/Fe2+ NRAMP family transporter
VQAKVTTTLKKRGSRFQRFFRQALPSIITGGAGDDPAGVLTYTTIGATTGFSQLWLLILTTPMLVAAVSMADRIARTTRTGLITVLRERHGRMAAGLVMMLLVIANVGVISADVSAVAEVLQIFTGIRWEWFVPIILVLLLIVLRTGYTRTRMILTAFALGLMTYAVAAVMAHPKWGTVLQAMVVPQISFDHNWMLAALGLLGATVSPYMLFWQADEEIEELRQDSPVEENISGIWGGMIFSNVVSLFIIIAAAAALHESGGQISTVFDAAKALSPLGRIGNFAFIIGIIGAGILALPVFAGTTAYAMAEVFGWMEGLDEPVALARGFYIVLGAVLLGGALISILPNFNPADALFYSQVFNGVLLPIIMVVLMMLSNDTKVIGMNRNPLWVNLMAVVTIFVALAANFAALFGN